jgi:hypothetical protein
MTWQKFYSNNIDGYLLSDLREMNKIKVEGAGNCGYPMLMSILSGMELLGGLMDDKKWNSNDGRKYFDNFYSGYFKNLHSDYSAENIENEIYSLIRNKLAHTFLTALKFQVAKNSEDSPVTKRGLFIRLDVGLIFNDFEKSVRALKVELLDNPELAKIFEQRLGDIIKKYGPIPTDVVRLAAQPNVTISGSLSSIVQNSKYSSLATTAIPIDIIQKKSEETQDQA